MIRVSQSLWKCTCDDRDLFQSRTIGYLYITMSFSALNRLFRRWCNATYIVGTKHLTLLSKILSTARTDNCRSWTSFKVRAGRYQNLWISALLCHLCDQQGRFLIRAPSFSTSPSFAPLHMLYSLGYNSHVYELWYTHSTTRQVAWLHTVTPLWK